MIKYDIIFKIYLIFSPNRQKNRIKSRELYFKVIYCYIIYTIHIKPFKYAVENGAEILCIHTDADDSDDREVFDHKINPFLTALSQTNADDCCQIVVPLIPVQEIEAWMMANKHLLKQQMGTTMSDNDLGLQNKPESYADPKQAIENAVSEVRKTMSKRFRNQISIGQLYEAMGRHLEIQDLMQLESFRKYIDNLHHALVQLHICR
mgnify:CR=1 FL=1